MGTDQAHATLHVGFDFGQAIPLNDGMPTPTIHVQHDRISIVISGWVFGPTAFVNGANDIGASLIETGL